jgi:hypothetical protein
MSRNVVYPRPTSVITRSFDAIEDAEAPAPTAPAATPEKPDSYSEKLLKYIPAEVIAFFLPAYALVQDPSKPKAYKWLALGFGLVGTLGYLKARADQENPPRWYFYILSAFSFMIWAVGTTQARELFGLEDDISKFFVLVGVFLIPLIDELLTKRSPKVEPVVPEPNPVGS